MWISQSNTLGSSFIQLWRQFPHLPKIIVWQKSRLNPYLRRCSSHHCVYLRNYPVQCAMDIRTVSPAVPMVWTFHFPTHTPVDILLPFVNGVRIGQPILQPYLTLRSRLFLVMPTKGCYSLHSRFSSALIPVIAALVIGPYPHFTYTTWSTSKMGIGPPMNSEVGNRIQSAHT